MAAAVALAAEEGIEAEEGGSTFTEDKGGNISGDDIAKAIALGLKVLDLVLAFKKSSELTTDLKNDRWTIGLVLRDEDRDDLVRKGLIDAYYSTDNIKRLIRANKLPQLWTVKHAVLQGFAPEIRRQRLVQRRVKDFKILAGLVKGNLTKDELKSEGMAESILRKQKERDDMVNRVVTDTLR